MTGAAEQELYKNCIYYERPEETTVLFTIVNRIQNEEQNCIMTGGVRFGAPRKRKWNEGREKNILGEWNTDARELSENNIQTFWEGNWDQQHFLCKNCFISFRWKKLECRMNNTFFSGSINEWHCKRTVN